MFGEHVSDAKKGAPDSHMHKHWEIHHGGRRTEFTFNIIGHFKSPLERQIAEGVRISRTGATRLLNSKAVYSRCGIVRLTIDKKEETNLGDMEKNMVFVFI